MTEVMTPANHGLGSYIFLRPAQLADMVQEYDRRQEGDSQGSNPLGRGDNSYNSRHAGLYRQKESARKFTDQDLHDLKFTQKGQRKGMVGRRTQPGMSWRSHSTWC